MRSPFYLCCVLLEKKTAARCADAGLIEEALKKQRNPTFRHFDPPNVHKDAPFLATEENGTEGLNCKKHALKEANLKEANLRC